MFFFSLLKNQYNEIIIAPTAMMSHLHHLFAFMLSSLFATWTNKLSMFYYVPIVLLFNSLFLMNYYALRCMFAFTLEIKTRLIKFITLALTYRGFKCFEIRLFAWV